MSERGPRALLASRFDDAFHAHGALRRRALERLGGAVAVFDPEHLGLLDRLRRVEPGARFARALGHAAPDLVVAAMTEPAGFEAVTASRPHSSAVWAGWFLGDLGPDAPRLAESFDHLFAAGTDVAARLARETGRPVHYLPPACDPSVHRPLRARGLYRANVVFAGAATPRREELLAELVEFGIAVWGPGWRRTRLRDYCRGELPGTEDFVRAYNGATVAVNIHREDAGGSGAGGASCNQRVFELASIGAPQVVDLRADLPRNFEVGGELLAYRTGAELRAQVRELLEDDALRERVAAAGRRRALREHTYMHRMKRLLETAGVRPA